MDRDYRQSGGRVSGDVTVNVQGLEGIQSALNTVIPQHFQGAYLQKMLAAAATPIVNDAKRRAPIVTGTLKADIYQFRDPASTSTQQIRGISVRTGKRATKGHGDAYYWVWVEYGHAVITTESFKSLGTSTKGFFGKTVRAVPPNPFMRIAYETQKQAALDAFIKAAGIQLNVAANKLGFF